MRTSSTNSARLSLANLALAIAALALLAPLPSLAAVTLGQANTTSLSSGLVGYWPLDGATTNWSTGITRDVSGQGNNGSLISLGTTSAPTLGKIGQALSFKNGTGYVNIPSSSTFQIGTGDFTISHWVKFDTFPAQYQTTLDGGYVSSAGVLIEFDHVTNNVRLYIRGTPAGPHILAFSFTPITGVWYDFVATRSGSSVSAYVNGIQIGSSQTDTTSIAQANWIIGKYSGGEPTYGTIDDFRFYNRALSATEVALLYASGKANVGHANTTSISSGLVGYWPLDGSTINWKTGTVSDMSGQGNNGSQISLSTTTSVVAGKIGQALKFGGGVKVQTTSVSSIPSGGSARTVSAWIKPTGTGGTILSTNAASGQKYIVSMGNSGGTWYLFTDGVNGGNNITVTGSQIAPLNQWSHIIFVLDGSNGWSYYLNGNYVKSGTFGIAINTAAPTSVTIGDRLDVPITYAFNGAIDDTRIYNRALSAAEIAQLYDTGSTNVAHSNATPGIGLNSGLVGYWTFDGPNINWKTGTIVDSSGQGNNGVPVSLGTTTSPTIGKIGQALKFSGSNYIDIPSSSSLNPTAAITVNAWTKTTNTTPGYRYITTKHDDSFYFAINPSQQAAFYLAGVGGWLNGTSAINDGKWHLVTGTYDGANMRIYVDGVQQNSLVASGAITSGVTSVQIGSRSSASDWPGSIDDVRIYNRALSATEVQLLYKMGK